MGEMGNMEGNGRKGEEQTTPDWDLIPVVVWGWPRRPRAWWARLAGLKHSHITISLGYHMWDQPQQGVGQAFYAPSYVRDKGRAPVVAITVRPKHYAPAVGRVLEQIEGRKTQVIRSAFRFLRLWPVPAWNCTSPVRLILGALDINVRGETPDAILRELEGRRDMAFCATDSAGSD
jgi:hypothetical protein